MTWAVIGTTDNPYLFQTVKESIDIVEAARHFGLEPDRNGWCQCPFHNEKTASFHLYKQRGKCFGCNWSGDVIDLAASICGCGPLKLEFEPTAPEREIPIPWAAAVRWLDYLEDCQNLLAFGEEQEVRRAKPVIDALVGKIQRRKEK